MIPLLLGCAGGIDDGDSLDEELRAPAKLDALQLSDVLVHLDWHDRLQRESGFAIERAAPNAGFSEIARTDANATSFVDASAPVGAVRYRVRGFRDHPRQKTTYSAYTPAAELTVHAPPRPPFARPAVPVGLNYDGEKIIARFFPDPNMLIDEVWDGHMDMVDADLANIARMGFNVVRLTIQFEQFVGNSNGQLVANEHQLQNLVTFVHSAGAHGVFVDLTGNNFFRKSATPAWYMADDDEGRLRAQEFFWNVVSARLVNEPAVMMYGLQNEPFILDSDSDSNVLGAFGGLPHAYYQNVQFLKLTQLWNDWLRQKYHTRERLLRAWGPLPLGVGFGNIPTGRSDNPARQSDFGHFQDQLAVTWTRRLTDAIRQNDCEWQAGDGVWMGCHHLVAFSSPESPIKPDGYSHFPAYLLKDIVDVMAIHTYPGFAGPNQYHELQARAAYFGKQPVFIEEIFPLGPGTEDFLHWSLSSVGGFVTQWFGKTLDDYKAQTSLSVGDSVEVDWLSKWMFIGALSKRTAPLDRSSGHAQLTLSHDGMSNRIRFDAAALQAVFDQFNALTAQYGSVDITWVP
jgi:hypothetical protein